MLQYSVRQLVVPPSHPIQPARPRHTFRAPQPRPAISVSNEGREMGADHLANSTSTSLSSQRRRAPLRRHKHGENSFHHQARTEHALTLSDHRQSSKARLYKFPPETRGALRRFRLGPRPRYAGCSNSNILSQEHFACPRALPHRRRNPWRREPLETETPETCLRDEARRRGVRSAPLRTRRTRCRQGGWGLLPWVGGKCASMGGRCAGVAVMGVKWSRRERKGI